MTDVIYPFGFIISKGYTTLDPAGSSSGKRHTLDKDNAGEVVFFLKGVTIDPYPAYVKES
jgi:hypothetical protein